MQGGKDVYCEKPLTLTIGEAKALVEAVRKHGRVLQTGSQQRSERGCSAGPVDYVRNGRLGKITEVHVALVGPDQRAVRPAAAAAPAGVNWDLWLGQAPQRATTRCSAARRSIPAKYPYYPGWRNFREFSGGLRHRLRRPPPRHRPMGPGDGPVRTGGESCPPPSRGDQYGASLIYRGSPAGDEIKVTHVRDVYEVDAVDRQGKPERRKEKTGILFIGEKRQAVRQPQATS